MGGEVRIFGFYTNTQTKKKTKQEAHEELRGPSVVIIYFFIYVCPLFDSPGFWFVCLSRFFVIKT